jgi:hypothetical protein
MNKVLDILNNYEKIIKYCKRYNEIENDLDYLKEKIIIDVFISLTTDLNWLNECNNKLKEHVLLYDNIEEYKLNRPNISRIMEKCHEMLLDIMKKSKILINNHYSKLSVIK